MITLRITGIRELDNALRAMPAALTHRELGKAHFQAAKVLVEKEKQLAPRGKTGNLVNSIGTEKLPISKASALGAVRTGPRRGGNYKGFAGHLVEFGTKRRRTRRGANRGIMPAIPFVRPAFKSTEGQVNSSIVGFILSTLEKTVRRNLKK
jgi:HK97 gp10 family phage protein